MIDAAKRLFLEHGYERTTIGDILEVSGGSRSTLVDLFGGKEGLFTEVMLESSRHIRAIFDALEASDAPPEIAIKEMARRFVFAVFEVETMAMFRVLIAEGPRFPDIVQAFFRLGPKVGHAKLVAYFQRGIDAGLLRPGDPAAMSFAFRGMLLVDAEILTVVGDSLAEQRAGALARVDAVVDIFLGGVIVRPR